MLKSIVVVFTAVIVIATVVYGATEEEMNKIGEETYQRQHHNQQQMATQRQGRTFDGGFLTSGFVTALSSLGTIGVLGLILLGILLLPTILSLLSTGVLGVKRGFSDGYQVDKHAILERMSMLHDVWQKFDIKDSQCRKRLICEVHSVESELGPSARKIIKFVDYVGSTGTLNLAPLFKNMVQEYVSAARLGKESKDCSSFSSCPYSFAEQIKSQRTFN